MAARPVTHNRDGQRPGTGRYGHLSVRDLRELLAQPWIGGVVKEQVEAELGAREAAGRPDAAPRAPTAPDGINEDDWRRMNGAEREWALRLRADPRVRRWHFESVKLRLADGTWYTPDFFLELVDGTFEVNEVKGFWRDDARVKIKVAAKDYPWPFVAARKRKKKEGGGWAIERFNGEAGSLRSLS